MQSGHSSFSLVFLLLLLLLLGLAGSLISVDYVYDRPRFFAFSCFFAAFSLVVVVVVGMFD